MWHAKTDSREMMFDISVKPASADGRQRPCGDQRQEPAIDHTSRNHELTRNRPPGCQPKHKAESWEPTARKSLHNLTERLKLVKQPPLHQQARRHKVEAETLKPKAPCQILLMPSSPDVDQTRSSESEGHGEAQEKDRRMCMIGATST